VPSTYKGPVRKITKRKEEKLNALGMPAEPAPSMPPWMALASLDVSKRCARHLFRLEGEGGKKCFPNLVGA
jgi:hypothetical protein